jgi:hypothetical protein
MEPGFFSNFKRKKGHYYDKIQSRVMKLVLAISIVMSDNYFKLYLEWLLRKSELKQKLNEMLTPALPTTFPNLITRVFQNKYLIKKKPDTMTLNNYEINYKKLMQNC